MSEQRPKAGDPCGMCGRRDCPTPVAREWLEAQGMAIAAEMADPSPARLSGDAHGP
jgi:hypothetical protein